MLQCWWDARCSDGSQESEETNVEAGHMMMCTLDQMYVNVVSV